MIIAITDERGGMDKSILAGRLAARFDVAVMADEALHGPVDAFNIARSNGADVFAVKIAQSGGLIPAQQVSTVAQLAGIGL